MVPCIIVVAAVIAAHPVAKIGSRVVEYQEIHCDEQQAALMSKPVSECENIEQQRLAATIVAALLEHAYQELGIKAAPGEIAAALKHYNADASYFERASRAANALPNAVRQVLDGNNLHTVWATEVASNGMTEAMFAQYVKVLSNPTAMKRTIDDATPDALQRKFEDSLRNEIQLGRLHEYLTSSASKLGIARDDYAERFWNNLVSSFPVVILDPRFHMPDLRRIA